MQLEPEVVEFVLKNFLDGNILPSTDSRNYNASDPEERVECCVELLGLDWEMNREVMLTLEDVADVTTDKIVKAFITTLTDVGYFGDDCSRGR